MRTMKGEMPLKCTEVAGGDDNSRSCNAVAGTQVHCDFASVVIGCGDEAVEIPNIVYSNLQISNAFLESRILGKMSSTLKRQLEKFNITVHIQAVLLPKRDGNYGVAIWQKHAVDGTSVMHKISFTKQHIMEGLFFVQNFNIQCTKTGMRVVDVVLRNDGLVVNNEQLVV